jgi:hypothetical protein
MDAASYFDVDVSTLIYIQRQAPEDIFTNLVLFLQNSELILSESLFVKSYVCVTFQYQALKLLVFIDGSNFNFVLRTSTQA